MNSIINYTSTDFDLLAKFGAEYYLPRQKTIARARQDSLYTFTTYIGEHEVNIEAGDCAYYIADGSAYLKSGPAKINSSSHLICHELDCEKRILSADTNDVHGMRETLPKEARISRYYDMVERYWREQVLKGVDKRAE